MQVALTGKCALVTGGTRGIGRAISLTLASCGAAVAAIYRSDASAAQRTLADLSKLPGGDACCAIEADIGDEVEARAAVETAIRNLGGSLDYLVLNAAAGGRGRLTEISPEEWKRPFDVNVHGAYYVVRAAAPRMRQGASIVFISSGAGHDPLMGLSAYGASKAAVNHIAGVLAQELGPDGIRVNVVSPGHTETGDADINASPERFTPAQRAIADGTALRRLGTAQDVANAVLFFVSELSEFVTGQYLRVNGGRV